VELRDVIQSVVDDVELGKDRDEIFENFRINFIRFFDEQMDKHKITVSLKEDVVKEEATRIAENIRDFIDKIHKDRVKEVCLYE